MCTVPGTRDAAVKEKSKNKQVRISDLGEYSIFKGCWEETIKINK